MIEVEVKYKIDKEEFEKIEEKIKNCGKLVIEKFEEDFYFNSPVRDFRQSDEALRIRRDVEGVTLTYKGKKIDKETKTREEINVKVNDFEGIYKILEKLGFKFVRKVKKFRKIYIIDSIFVCLDEVESLGNFIEFEIDVNEGEAKSVEDAKNKLFKLAEKLGIKTEETITKSYLEMLEELNSE